MSDLSPDRPVDRPVPKRRAPTKRRASRVVLVLVAIVLVGNALVGDRGLVAMLRANLEFEELSAAIREIRRENDDLREDVRALSEEPRTIEELARRELGLIRPGERLFIVRATPVAPTPVPATNQP